METVERETSGFHPIGDAVVPPSLVRGRGWEFVTINHVRVLIHFWPISASEFEVLGLWKCCPCQDYVAQSLSVRVQYAFNVFEILICNIIQIIISHNTGIYFVFN